MRFLKLLTLLGLLLTYSFGQTYWIAREPSSTVTAAEAQGLAELADAIDGISSTEADRLFAIAEQGDASFDALVVDSLDLGTLYGEPLIYGTATGLDFQGAYSNAAIDLSDIVLNHSGSSGPVMIRAGSYASPVTSADAHQSGMIRLYGSNSATVDDGTGFYDRIIFANSQITGNKSAFPISALVEIRDVGAEEGPVAAMAGQFIAHMTTDGSKLDSTASATDGMFGLWTKVASIVGSVTDATSRVAPIWIDNQMSGTVNGEEYGIFATTGGTRPDAFVGFETSSSGWDYLFYFDETAYDQAPVSTMTPATNTNAADGSLIINLNGTDYYIPYYGIGKD